MTFSIVAREECEGEDSPATRFGVGVTTNNPGIGVFCPAVSADGAVATQYQTYGEAGPQILDCLEMGMSAGTAISAVLETVENARKLQIHALGDNSRGVHHGAGLDSYHEETGHVLGDVSKGNCSVAGNSLVNRETLTATAGTFGAASTERELAERLIEALAAGDEAGGDARDNDVRSGAILVVDPTAGVANEWYNDVRVDASPTPLADLRSQYDRAKEYHEQASDEWASSS